MGPRGPLDLDEILVQESLLEVKMNKKFPILERIVWQRGVSCFA
jgi:hypothetical protein